MEVCGQAASPGLPIPGCTAGRGCGELGEGGGPREWEHVSTGSQESQKEDTRMTGPRPGPVPLYTFPSLRIFLQKNLFNFPSSETMSRRFGVE